MRSDCRAILVCLVLLSAVASGAARAEQWRWLSGFTEASAPALTSLHSDIHATRLGTGLGVPVEDVHFRAEHLDVHLISGVIFHEPDLAGYPAGAFFNGQATVSFAPDDKKARRDLARFLGTEEVSTWPLTSAYFFTLRGTSLAEQLGVSAEEQVPYTGSEDYERCKKVLRQTGTNLLHAFLNREGRSGNAAYVLFSPEAIRTSGSPDAHLLYVFDPSRERPIELLAFGHERAHLDPRAHRFLEAYPAWKFQFWPIVWLRPFEDFIPQGRVDRYVTWLEVSKNGNVKEQASVVFAPAEGVSTMAFDLTARLQVSSATGPGGEALEFVQWKFLPDQPDFDPQVVVRAPKECKPGRACEIRFDSEGPLFDPSFVMDAMAEEDTWYPRLDDPEGSIYEMHCDVAKNMKAVAPGKLVSEEVSEGRRRYHFLTSRPHKASSFYVGPYDVHSEQADGTKVEMFTSSMRESIQQTLAVPVDVVTLENPEYAVQEVANAVKVFNRILNHPLEVEHLRVATTPTGHGRGFEGLLLLSLLAATRGDSSSADFFRAHEVAHQWWGNMVQPRHWPEDRWLSEAFAEYCAMEYYNLRFEKPEKTRQQMRDLWITPLVKGTEETVVDLTGERRDVDRAELSPLIDGTENVYTKGPLVLHMLRYLFQVQQKSDEGFWTLLQDFLEKYKYERASTEDFMRLTEEHMKGRLDWFWEQWIYGTEIPVIRWTSDLKKNDKGDWVLSVQARQEGTSYVVPIPVYVRMKDGRTFTTPLVMRGEEGTARALMRDKPAKITLNDNYEALVFLKE